MTTADDQGPGANVLGAGGGYLDSAGPVKVVLYEDAVPPASSPPSTTSCWPVMYRAAGEARK